VLVQQHAEHEGERVSTEQLVGRGVLGDAESRHTGDGAEVAVTRYLGL